MTDVIDLRRVMLADVAFSATCTAVLLLFADTVGEWLALDAALLRWVGLLLVAHVAILVWSVATDRVEPGSRYAVVANLGWVVVAVVVIAVGWLPTEAAIALGIVSVPVGAFGVVQWRGLR